MRLSIIDVTIGALVTVLAISTVSAQMMTLRPASAFWQFAINTPAPSPCSRKPRK
jgi:hypothetical protein